MMNAKYTAQKWMVFGTMYVGYILFVLNKKIFTFAMPTIQKEENLKKDDLGMIASSQMLAYTLSKFFAGLLADRFSPKMLFVIGLAFTGMFTVSFTFFQSVWMYSAVWFLLGLASGFGWPACAKILRQWYTPVEFGTWWSILSTSMNVAGSMGPPLTTAIIMNFSWRVSFLIPGIFAVLFSGVSLLTLLNSPEEIGFPSAQPEDKDKGEKTHGRGGWHDVLMSPFIWLISISYLVVFLIRTAALDWAQLYIIQECQQSQYMGSTFISSLEVGGIIGSVFAGYVADKAVAYSKKKPDRTKGSPRMLVVFGLVSGIFISLHLLLFTVSPSSSKVWIIFIGFCLGFSLYGPISIYGVLAIESAPSHLAGTSHAMVALSANVGAVMAGLPLSMIAKRYDWRGAFFLLEMLVLVILVLKIFGRNVEPKIIAIKKKMQ